MTQTDPLAGAYVEQARRGAKRTALMLGMLALAFYLGFIVLYW